MVDALRIVYFGTPGFAVPTLGRLIASRHQVVALVSQPDRPRGRGQKVQPTPTKAVATEAGVPVLQPTRLKDPGLAADLGAVAPDLGVVAAYGRLIPDALLTLPRLGMINVHGSILPFYRGAAPVHRAVLAGDPETGVTIMRVVSELDAGPTFAMRKHPIGAEDTSAEVEAALSVLGADLLLEVVDQLAAGTARETPQDHARATFAPKLTKEEGRIDWTRPAAAIHNQVRGLHPWPLAYAQLSSRRVLIRRTRTLLAPPAGAPAGAVVGANADGIDVACGDGSLLRVLEIQAEGRRPMPARDFIAGHRLDAGTRFGPA